MMYIFTWFDRHMHCSPISLMHLTSSYSLLGLQSNSFTRDFSTRILTCFLSKL